MAGRPQPSAGQPRLAGAATARAEAHAVRLALIYAQKRGETERALIVLEQAGPRRRETRTAERGRPAEVWMPVLQTPPDSACQLNGA